MPGKRLRSVTKKRRPVYHALRQAGMSKASSARIANAGRTKKGRKKMARKAARTRRRRG